MSIAMTRIRTGRFRNLEMNKLCGSELCKRIYFVCQKSKSVTYQSNQNLRPQ